MPLNITITTDYEAKASYIRLQPKGTASVRQIILPEGADVADAGVCILDLDAEGRLIGLEILNVLKHVSVSVSSGDGDPCNGESQ